MIPDSISLPSNAADSKWPHVLFAYKCAASPVCCTTAILNDVQSLRRTTSLFTGAVSASIQKDPGTWDKVVNANDWFTDSNIVIAMAVKRGLFRFAVPVEAYRGAAGRSQQLGKSNRAKVGERHVNHATQRESQCEIILF